jgi:hypothetical protein
MHQACLKMHPTATFQCDFLFSALEACKAAAAPANTAPPLAAFVPAAPALPVAASTSATAANTCQADQKAYSACLKEHPTATFHCDFLFGALEACKARM